VIAEATAELRDPPEEREPVARFVPALPRHVHDERPRHLCRFQDEARAVLDVADLDVGEHPVEDGDERGPRLGRGEVPEASGYRRAGREARIAGRCGGHGERERAGGFARGDAADFARQHVEGLRGEQRHLS